MKTITSIILIFSLVFSLYAQEETPTAEELQEGTKELQEQVQSLMNFYEKYEEKTTDKDKKQAYDKAIDKLDNKGEATEKDKNDAFQIIDAYIKADKAPSNPQPKREEVTLENNPEIKQQAQAQFDSALATLKGMSYEEYETYIWKIQPMATRKEVKESYNDLHEDDGKSVKISSADNEDTEVQKQVRALELMEKATTYKEYSAAIRVINPSLKDDEIRKAWDNRE